MTLQLKPEIAAKLEALANAQGFSVEDYVNQLVERELSLIEPASSSSEDSGMVWEDGLYVYKTGKPLPAHIIAHAIRRSREERLERILGELS